MTFFFNLSKKILSYFIYATKWYFSLTITYFFIIINNHYSIISKTIIYYFNLSVYGKFFVFLAYFGLQAYFLYLIDNFIFDQYFFNLLSFLYQDIIFQDHLEPIKNNMGLDSQPLNNAVDESLLTEIKDPLQEKSSVPEKKLIKTSGIFLFVVSIIIIILIGGGGGTF